MSAAERQRVDIWLVRARFAKTRAAAARLVAEGGVRLVHNGLSRRIEKPSAELETGDALLFSLCGTLHAVRVLALPARRGPAPEARTLYSELDADAVA